MTVEVRRADPPHRAQSPVCPSLPSAPSCSRRHWAGPVSHSQPPAETSSLPPASGGPRAAPPGASSHSTKELFLCCLHAASLRPPQPSVALIFSVPLPLPAPLPQLLVESSGCHNGPGFGTGEEQGKASHLMELCLTRAERPQPCTRTQ